MHGLKKYKDVFDLIDHFKTEDECFSYLEDLYWFNGVISPFDSSSEVYTLSKEHHYMCKNTQKIFTVKNFTVFLGSRIPLRKWFVILYLYFKEGYSILKISKILNLTYVSTYKSIQKIKSRELDCLEIYEGRLHNEDKALFKKWLDICGNILN